MRAHHDRDAKLLGANSCVYRVEIREGTALDAAVINRIADASFDRLYAYFARRGVRRAKPLLVAAEADTVAGFLEGFLFDGIPPIGYIYFVAVDTGHRQKGLGRALVIAALDAFRAQNATRVFAAVPRENDVSRRLFERLGFAEVPKSVLRRWYGWRGIGVRMRMVIAPHEALLVHTFTDLPRAPAQEGPATSS